jgi:DNA-binding response OmpR family regulator
MTAKASAPRPRIAVVEDDEDLAFTLTYNLKKDGRYEVERYAGGLVALDALLARPPDLVLLDLNLPDVDGLTICRELRKGEETRKIPILMLTARVEERDKLLGFELGADDYVTKPFSIRELLARVKAFVRRQGPESAGSEFGDCRLDLTAHKLFKKGVEIELTAKEFRLLEFFVKRAGRALTRESILEAVWGDEVIVTDRSVDRCVTTLRSKIEPDTRNPRFIHTIRDIGYRFEN